MGTDFSAFSSMFEEEGTISAGLSLKKEFETSTSYFAAPEPGREGVINDIVAGMFPTKQGYGR